MVRVTAHFFLIGAALFGATVVLAALEEPTPRPLVVSVPQGASELEIRGRVDETLLVEEGLRLGWHLTDPVIRRQLVKNVCFVDGRSSDDAASLSPDEERLFFERAQELGMHRADPVVRQRLVMRAHRAIERGAMRTPPTTAELSGYLEENGERFERPGRVRFNQVFLSRQRRGDQLDDDARRLGERLRTEPVSPEKAYRLGDPLLLVDSREEPPPEVTVSELDRRYGRGFGQAVNKAPMQQWRGPLRSAFGLHYVWVHEGRAASLPLLEDVRSQVMASYVQNIVRPRAIREHVEQLRAYYVVRLDREEQIEAP